MSVVVDGIPDALAHIPCIVVTLLLLLRMCFVCCRLQLDGSMLVLVRDSCLYQLGCELISSIMVPIVLTIAWYGWYSRTQKYVAEAALSQ